MGLVQMFYDIDHETRGHMDKAASFANPDTWPALCLCAGRPVHHEHRAKSRHRGFDSVGVTEFLPIHTRNTSRARNTTRGNWFPFWLHIRGALAMEPVDAPADSRRTHAKLGRVDLFPDISLQR